MSHQEVRAASMCIHYVHAVAVAVHLGEALQARELPLRLLYEPLVLADLDDLL
jgi:hypothetical protein